MFCTFKSSLFLNMNSKRWVSEKHSSVGTRLDYVYYSRVTECVWNSLEIIIYDLYYDTVPHII